MRRIEMVGRKFGRLKVVAQDPTRNSHYLKYICNCDCGKTGISVSGFALRSGQTKSCGCLHREVMNKVKSIDLTGKPFGRLTAIRPTDQRYSGFVVWECKCDCGNTAYVPSNWLIHGNKSSCGKCGYRADVARERLTKWRTPEEIDLIAKFNRMVTRCYNKKSKDYPDYGGRGIYICQEWIEDRRKFVDWALANGYKLGLTIDRIDVNDIYAPWNCRWVTNYVQANNKRTNRFIEYCGIKGTISEWATLLSVPKPLLYQLAMVDKELMDLQEYIQFKWNLMSSDEREIALSSLNEVRKEV